MSPSSAMSAAPRYRCKYHSCQTTCARRADMKRHEVQRHQSSKVFCPQAECKFRGTTRPAVIRRHFEHRHPKLSFKEIEEFLVDKFGGDDKTTDRKVATNDVPPPPEAEHWRRSSQDSSSSESSLSSVTSYDGSGYTTVHYPQMTNLTGSARILSSLATDHPYETAPNSYQKPSTAETIPYNVPQQPFANYMFDSTACFEPSPLQYGDPTAHDFLTFVEGLWRAAPAYQQHPLVEYTERFVN